MSEPTPEQKQLAINDLTRIIELLKRGTFTGADANDINLSLNFLTGNIAAISGGPVAVPDDKPKKVKAGAKA